MTEKVIHQLVVGASEGDAITQMAINVRDELRKHCSSEVFARWRLGDWAEQECRSIEDLPVSSEVDLLVYHLSIGQREVHDTLMSRTERIVISYHNITPAHFYDRFNPQFAEDLRLGRRELDLLADRVVLAIADSDFNAGDLRSTGYQNIEIVPAGLNPSRLVDLDFDVHLLGQLVSRFPGGYVVAVGQVLPHKRIEQLLSTMHMFNSTFWGRVGLVVCGAIRQEGYFRALQEFSKRTFFCDVLFTDSVTDQELATYIRGASAFLGMSDHEGFCIPPIEAASMGVPVVIKGTGAIPETLGNAGLVLPPDASPTLAAEAVAEAVFQSDVREKLILEGHRRILELETKPSASIAVEKLLAVLQ